MKPSSILKLKSTVPPQAEVFVPWMPLMRRLNQSYYWPEYRGVSISAVNRISARMIHQSLFSLSFRLLRVHYAVKFSSFDREMNYLITAAAEDSDESNFN